jgi:hypothetical protein
MPNVQWITPDDGQKNCPKHVEFLEKQNKFGKLVRLLVELKRKFECSDEDHQIAEQNEKAEHQSITL